MGRRIGGEQNDLASLGPNTSLSFCIFKSAFTQNSSKIHQAWDWLELVREKPSGGGLREGARRLAGGAGA